MRFLLFFIFIIVACNNGQGSKSVSADIETIELATLRNERIDFAQYKGKAVFINFWATWCKPCIEEMPTIKNAIDSLGNQNIRFLFASDEPADDIRSFEKENKFQFNYVKANNMAEMGIIGLPTTFIFDSRGKKVFSEMGYRKWNEPENLQLLLNIIKQ